MLSVEMPRSDPEWLISLLDQAFHVTEGIALVDLNPETVLLYCGPVLLVSNGASLLSTLLDLTQRTGSLCIRRYPGNRLRY